MKTQRGFVSAFLLGMAALAIIVGGMYLFVNKKAEAPIVPVNIDEKLYVKGMQKYADDEFGFSFWYPVTWILNDINTNLNYASAYVGGKVVKSVSVSPTGQAGDGIRIVNFVSDDKSIRDNSNCGPADGCPSAIRYYFDSGVHIWMKESRFDYGQYSSPATIKPADVSRNGMGGLHILQGNARFGSNVIIPLSAKNFVIVYDEGAGANNIVPLAKTIVAKDPTVARPLSIEKQKDIINLEGLSYGAFGTKMGSWYVDSNSVFDSFGNRLTFANASTFRLIKKYSDGYIQETPYATDGNRVYTSWIPGGQVLALADPLSFVPIRQEYQIPYAEGSGRYGHSFTSDDTQFSKDKSHVWYRAKLIQGADPTTFVVTGNTHVRNSYNVYVLAHDANHEYGLDVNDSLTIDNVAMR